MNLITLPFNIKRWRKSLVHVIPNASGSSLKDKVLLYVKTGVIWLLHIALIFTLQVIFLFLFASSSYCFILFFKCLNKIKHRSNKWKRFGVRFFFCFFEGVSFGGVISFLCLLYRTHLQLPFLCFAA